MDLDKLNKQKKFYVDNNNIKNIKRICIKEILLKK